MTDVFSKEKRSEVMSKIRGKGNKDTELRFLRILKNNHISGWRRNQEVFGKPDVIFRQEKIAIFLDGCFWHSCPIHSTKPKNNMEFWEKKLTANRNRDKLVNRELKKRGWTVIRIWEHDCNDEKKILKRVKGY